MVNRRLSPIITRPTNVPECISTSTERPACARSTLYPPHSGQMYCSSSNASPQPRQMYTGSTSSTCFRLVSIPITRTYTSTHGHKWYMSCGKAHRSLRILVSLPQTDQCREIVYGSQAHSTQKSYHTRTNYISVTGFLNMITRVDTDRSE